MLHDVSGLPIGVLVQIALLICLQERISPGVLSPSLSLFGFRHDIFDYLFVRWVRHVPSIFKTVRPAAHVPAARSAVFPAKLHRIHRIWT
ncbi:hypothetical protein LY76DRAFT_341599 [Colletotrichum caudatum]|nr:hypothetical protein LY76DRAFT_341599 [Colletotrichum caudatum]